MFTESTDLTQDYIFAADDDKTLYVHDDSRRQHAVFMDIFSPKTKDFKILHKLLNIADSYIEKSLENIKTPIYERFHTINNMINLPNNHKINFYREEDLLFCMCCGAKLHPLSVADNDDCMCYKCEGKNYYNFQNIFIMSLEE